MPTLPFRHAREELTITYPDTLDAETVRIVVRRLFDGGKIPPRGFDPMESLSLSFEFRTAGWTVEIEGRTYGMALVADEITIA